MKYLNFYAKKDIKSFDYSKEIIICNHKHELYVQI